ncbi:MAG: glycosyltransferase family 4 protein [Desulfurococcaceae archaeon]
MRLLYVAPRYYPSVGGLEYVVKSVAERLALRGHGVTVLCGEPGIGEPREEWINGVHVVRWPVWAPRGAYHFPRMRSALEQWLLNTARESDVVHFHSVHSVFTVYSLSVLKNSGVHRVLTPHYHGTGHTFFRRTLWILWRRYVRRALASVDVVHSVSSYEEQLLARDFGVKPVVVEHGVEEWILEVPWNPSGYAMYSGRIEKYKNVHRLANIVKHLNEMGLNLELKIFGEGSFKHKLKHYLDKLGVKYELKPPQRYDEYINYLSRASLFGLLSEREAFGQTVNEANAIGVPVVIAEPWGLNFRERTRTLIVNLSMSDEEIARRVAAFLDEARKQPKPKVPSWSQVVDLYIRILYGRVYLEEPLKRLID